MNYLHKKFKKYKKYDELICDLKETNKQMVQFAEELKKLF